MLTRSMRVVPDPQAQGMYCSDLGGRRVPEPGDLDRYAVNLGQTAAQVKEYFDVGVYRNIIDMLQTIDGVLRRWGQDIVNQLNCVTTSGLITGGSCHREGDPSESPLNMWGRGGGGCLLTGAIGYAAGKIGPHNKAEARMYAEQQAKKAGFALQKYNVGFFQVPDLLNLARTINYEMNRVRLPVPHNFRQIANAIQGRDYYLCADKHPYLAQKHNWGTKPGYYASRSQKAAYTAKVRAVLDQNYINGCELLDVYRQLLIAAHNMKTGVRREIDAANLAKKVQEETIRREQEALISRQQAEEQARKRELEILAEKKAQYERELAEAARLAEEMAATRERLAAEQAALEASKQAATTQEEVIQIENQQTEIAQAAIEVDRVEADKARQAEVTVEAAKNLETEIGQKKQELIQAGVVGPGAPAPELPKPGLPLPVILTAAGFLLL